jgi:DnaD/phage-associated family protein
MEEKMANKRMFSLSVVDTDNFLEMPQSTQNLYFHLGMRADDDGFVNNCKKILKFIGASEDDLKLLIAKKYIIPFESGVIVIRHWRLNNYLQKDRYHETIYQEEKSLLTTDESNVYNLYTDCIPRIDKNSIDKYSIDKNSIVENDIQQIVEFYNNNIGLITPNIYEILESYLKDMEKDLILLALKKADESNIRNMNYIRGILNNWVNAGIKTVLQAQEEEQKFKNNKKIEQHQETEEERKARILKEMEEYQKK